MQETNVMKDLLEKADKEVLDVLNLLKKKFSRWEFQVQYMARRRTPRQKRWNEIRSQSLVKLAEDLEQFGKKPIPWTKPEDFRKE